MILFLCLLLSLSSYSYSTIGSLSISGKTFLSTTPEQLHLSPGSDPTKLQVSWTTGVSSKGSEVQWGESPTALNQWAGGSNWTFSPVCDFGWEGWLHKAEMSGLQPGHKYFYRVGDSQRNEWSQIIPFTAPDYQKDSIFIAVGGDMGTYELFGWEVAKQMHEDDLTHSFDAFWLVGDLAYSTVTPPTNNIEYLFDLFMRQEEPLVSHTLFMVSFGNHEFTDPSAKSGSLEHLEYVQRFSMPSNGGPHNLYYSYQHGPVTYISFCSEHQLVPQCNYAPGSPQYNWLNTTLSSIDRSRTPWVIVGGHRPGYSSDTGTDSGPLLQYLEPLFVEHSVDVVLAGHMHCVELTTPVTYGKPHLEGVKKVGTNSWVMQKPQAPVYITVGSLGAVMDESFVEPPPPWSLFRNGTVEDWSYGYATLNVSRTSLHVEFHRHADRSAPLWSLLIQK